MEQGAPVEGTVGRGLRRQSKEWKENKSRGSRAEATDSRRNGRKISHGSRGMEATVKGMRRGIEGTGVEGMRRQSRNGR
jgi:hypothetical protein